MHKVQERLCATPYSFENRDWLTLRYRLSRLRDCKSQRCRERSVTGDEADGYCPQMKSHCPTLVGRKTKALWKGGLGGIPLQFQIKYLQELFDLTLIEIFLYFLCLHT